MNLVRFKGIGHTRPFYGDVKVARNHVKMPGNTCWTIAVPFINYTNVSGMVYWELSAHIELSRDSRL